MGLFVRSLEVSTNEELLGAWAGKPAAARLVGKFGGLSSLAQASFEDLQQVPGVGPSKAAAIRSAFLLAQRLARESYPEPPVMVCAERVAGFLREECRAATVEHFHVLCLNTRRRLICAELIAKGILDSVLVQLRLLGVVLSGVDKRTTLAQSLTAFVEQSFALEGASLKFRTSS